MPSDFFLAQTGTEIHAALPTGAKKAWLGCRFSLSGDGLSNFPSTLPNGSMVILTDETAISGHNAQRVTAELQQLVNQFSCSRVLLDFQRSMTGEAWNIAQAITRGLSCPVGVSEGFAKDLDCPVFLSPPPVNKSLSLYRAAWPGRELWLEAMPQQVAFHINKDGCRIKFDSPDREFIHKDPTLFCRYQIDLQEDLAVFTLARTWDDWFSWAHAEEGLCWIGLYQEFAQPDAQATALPQPASRSDRSASEICGTN